MFVNLIGAAFSWDEVYLDDCVDLSWHNDCVIYSIAG